VLAVRQATPLLAAARAAGVPAEYIGSTGGGDLTLPDGATISLRLLQSAHARFLPAWMEGAA
jgi:phosphoribosylformylglycinamidine synthase